MNYRRKTTIKAWRNLPSNDVPRWVLERNEIELGTLGALILVDWHGETARRATIPDGHWVVLEDGELYILAPADFAAQYEEDRPPVRASIRDTLGQPPYPPPFPTRRYGLSGTGPLGDPTDTAMMGDAEMMERVGTGPGGGGTRI